MGDEDEEGQKDQKDQRDQRDQEDQEDVVQVQREVVRITSMIEGGGDNECKAKALDSLYQGQGMLQEGDEDGESQINDSNLTQRE